MREHIHQAMQEAVAGDDDLDGSVLTGWVAVMEFTSPAGDRWLCRVDANAHGDDPAPSWQANGYLFDALHSPVVVVNEDEDE